MKHEQQPKPAIKGGAALTDEMFPDYEPAREGFRRLATECVERMVPGPTVTRVLQMLQVAMLLVEEDEDQARARSVGF